MQVKQLVSAGKCFVKRSICEVFFPVDAISAAHVYVDRQMAEFTHEVYFVHIAVNHNHSFHWLCFFPSLFLEVEEGEMVGLLVLSLTQQVVSDEL